MHPFSADQESPFLKAPDSSWIASNGLAFAVPDQFPVSPGHTLVVTRRVVPSWFDATASEQAALMDLVNEVKRLLDARYSPTPDGYNVGFNSGSAAGQTGSCYQRRSERRRQGQTLFLLSLSDRPSAKRVLAGTGKARFQAAGASSGLAKTGGGVRGCSVVGARKNSLVAEQ